MPVMSGENLAVAAGALVQNVLANQPYVYLPWNAKVEMYISASTQGNKFSLVAGGEQAARDSSLPGSNRYPVIPDDLVLQEFVRVGALLDLQFRNATIAVADFRWLVRLTPIG